LPSKHLLRLLYLGATLLSAQTRTVTDEEVRRVHNSTLLIDTHNDVTSRTVDGFDFGKRATDGQTDLPRMREGGIGAEFFAVYVAAEHVKGNHSARRTLEMIDTVRHDIIDRYPNDFQLALTADDIEAIHKRGKIAALMGLEGGHGIEDSLRLLRDYYALGCRYMTLTHTNTNNWADSSGDQDDPKVAHHNGLTDFGKQVVTEMNRLGMMVDISHVSDKTFWDALEVSSAPLIASHSSCKSLSNMFRNMSDDMIVAMAKKGGVVQINFICEFLSQASYDSSKALFAQVTTLTDAEFQKRVLENQKTMPKATLDDIADHIDHVKKIAGIDAVGIGTDFADWYCMPEGLEDVSKFPNLTRKLLERGYSAEDIRKIYGGNVLRVMRAAERVSARWDLSSK
jgi:membrane dipeptidase